MKKILFFSFLVINLLAFPKNSVEISPVSIKENIATIDSNLTIGTTGLLIQNGVIIANIEVISKDKVKYLPFSKFKNRSLATPILKPKTSDKIVLYKDYNRMTIIAPNQENYQKIVRKYPDMKIINSDLLVALNSDDIDELDKDNFQNFCNEYEVGLIYFNLDNDYVVDCKSFKTIEKIDTNGTTKYKKPLFTTYNIKNENMDYIKYYKNLIKVK